MRRGYRSMDEGCPHLYHREGGYRKWRSFKTVTIPYKIHLVYVEGVYGTVDSKEMTALGVRPHCRVADPILDETTLGWYTPLWDIETDDVGLGPYCAYCRDAILDLLQTKDD